MCVTTCSSRGKCLTGGSVDGYPALNEANGFDVVVEGAVKASAASATCAKGTACSESGSARSEPGDVACRATRPANS